MNEVDAGGALMSDVGREPAGMAARCEHGPGFQELDRGSAVAVDVS